MPDVGGIAGERLRSFIERIERLEEEKRALSDPEAREIVYGMPYDEWRKQHQKEATAEQKAAFAASEHKHARIG